MKLNFKYSHDHKKSLSDFNITYFEIISSVEISKYGRNLMSQIEELVEDKKHRYPTVIHYEFFDENDDMLSNQYSYANLLSFRLDEDMKSVQPNGLTIKQIKEFQNVPDETMLEIKNKVCKNCNGSYTLLDFYVDYEIKGSYIVVYYQYKIKPTDVKLLNE